jgi:hypothetical protein
VTKVVKPIKKENTEVIRKGITDPKKLWIGYKGKNDIHVFLMYRKRAALSVSPGFCVYTDKRLIPFTPYLSLGIYVLGYGNTVFPTRKSQIKL